MNRRRHVFTEETLDKIGERLEHTLQKSLKLLSQETDVCTKSNKITEITHTYCEYTHVRTMRIPVRHVANRNNHNHYTYSTNV